MGADGAADGGDAVYVVCRDGCIGCEVGIAMTAGARDGDCAAAEDDAAVSLTAATVG